ncbi:MAG: hypothetical protein L0207_00040 [Chlamydiae bacterium]|nr:hypothetical protein [Chlamydiota bacterium]
MANTNLQPTDSGIDPVLDPQLDKDLKAWEDAIAKYNEDKKALEKLLAMVVAMKNPLLAVQLMMLGVMGIQEDKVAGLAAANNIDTDLGNMIRGAQNTFNDWMANAANQPPMTGDVEKFRAAINQLETFLKDELAKLNAGQNTPFDATTLKTMIGALDSIKAPFGADWNSSDPNDMGRDFRQWMLQYQQGQVPPQIKVLQDSIAQFNQSTSALSAVTGTEMNFEAQQYDGYQGITKTGFDMYAQLVNASVQNQKTT